MYFVWCEDTVWPEVRNDYVFPNMEMGALSPQEKLPRGYLPRKISQHILRWLRAHWPISIVNKRPDMSTSESIHIWQFVTLKTAIDVSFSCVVLLLTMNFVTTYAKLMTVILDHISGFTANSWTFYDIISMVPASIDIRFVFNAKNDTKNFTARKSFNVQIFF